MEQEIKNAVLAAVGDWLHKGGVVVAWTLSWLQENGAVLSLLVGVAGLGISWYYKRKEDKRREQLFEAELRARQQSSGNAG